MSDSVDLTFKLLCGNPHQLVTDYGEGDLCFLDTFAGMIPAVVLRVLESGCGFEVCSGRVEIELTQTVGAYKKGEVLVARASHVVPREHRVCRGIFYRVNTGYRWAVKT